MVRLALDTGATRTLVNVAPLLVVGYTPEQASELIFVTTGSGVEHVPCLPVLSISALGRTRQDFSVLAHTLPQSAKIDGVLGLDFLRQGRLCIDFDLGHLTIE